MNNIYKSLEMATFFSKRQQDGMKNAFLDRNVKD